MVIVYKNHTQTLYIEVSKITKKNVGEEQGRRKFLKVGGGQALRDTFRIKKSI